MIILSLFSSALTHLEDPYIYPEFNCGEASAKKTDDEKLKSKIEAFLSILHVVVVTFEVIFLIIYLSLS